MQRDWSPIEYNVSQFRSVDDLGDAIVRASVENNKGHLPLIFFDEFDCDYERASLGWLKYFLAPMQDGTFYGPRQTIKLARAIFVFAGGINYTFNAFDVTAIQPQSVRLAKEAERRANAFRRLKGPDFISRLRGHIDIMPISVKPGEVKPIIRRAIILRSILERRELITNGVANINDDIVFAMLTLDSYRHGVRSLEAILQVCARLSGSIEKASMPAREQLQMHINVEEFLIRMYRGRHSKCHSECAYSGQMEHASGGASRPTEPELESVVSRPSTGINVPMASCVE